MSENDIRNYQLLLIKNYRKKSFSIETIERDMDNIRKLAKEIAEKEALKRAHYGTKEDTTLHQDEPIIANVIDAYNSLRKSVLKPDVMAENLRVYSDESNKFADFHIYEDKRAMEFIPVRKHK